jgi:hypothetical protein
MQIDFKAAMHRPTPRSNTGSVNLFHFEGEGFNAKIKEIEGRRVEPPGAHGCPLILAAYPAILNRAHTAQN